MIFNSLNIGASSLLAHQRAIDTISHNISNVNTPGFTRQDPVLSSLLLERSGGKDVGRGVKFGAINRSVDPLITGAQLRNGSNLAFWNAMKDGLGAVESVFGNLDVPGLSAVTDAFFQSWQQLANNPDNQGQRLNVRARAEDIVLQVSRMQRELSSARTGADAKVDSALSRTNTLLDTIGVLNRSLQHHSATSGSSANDLMDKRDLAINELSRLLPVQKVETKNGDLLIQTTAGDLLVQNSTVHHLARGAMQASGYANIAIANTGNVVQGLGKDGEIGGLITLRDSKLAGYIQKLDSFTSNLVFGVNQLHASGAGPVRASSLTSGQAATGPTTALNTANIPFASQITNGQFTIYAYDTAGQPIPPVPAGANTISVVPGLTTLNDIKTAITNAFPAGSVTATIDATNHLVINAGSNTIAFSRDSSNFLATYEINTFFKGGSSADFSVSETIRADAGKIATGSIDPATSLLAAGDNSVALSVLALQSSAFSFDGSPASTIQERGTALTSSYGIDANLAQQQQIYRNSESESLTKQREMISGVNLDEEMITMIKFQRAYEAAAKVIQTSNRMLDSLMGLIR